MPRPGRVTPGKEPVPNVQYAEWVTGSSWTGAGNLAPTGIRSPDRQACSESLHRLSYPDSQTSVCFGLSVHPLSQHYHRYSRVHCTLMSGYAAQSAVPKMLFADPKGSPTGCQGIRGYISVTATWNLLII